MPVVLYHVSTMAEPIDRPPLPLPWEQHTTTVGAAPPKAPAQLRLPPRQEEEADPVLPASAKMASQNGAPSPFFFFETRGWNSSTTRGWNSSADAQVMAPPQLQGDPCQLTTRAFSRPKWRGCSPQANLRGFFPPSTTARGCSPFFAHPAP